MRTYKRRSDKFTPTFSPNFLKNLFWALWIFSSIAVGQVTFEDSTGKKTTLPAGTYKVTVSKAATAPVVVDPIKPNPNLPNCGCSKADFEIVSITKKEGLIYEVAFDACNVNPLSYQVGAKAATFPPTSSKFTVDLTGFLPGEYTFKITSTGCNGKAEKRFIIAAANTDPPVPTNDGATLVPLRDPLLPATFQTGNYELRYVECRPDDHLDLKIEERNGKIYLTDTGRSLQSANYTLNGWTDPENVGKLENEAIQPYTLYHISKYSIDAGTIRDWWRSIYSPRAEAKRSELFFYVVPQGETWNPAGQSNNPIGKPLAFSNIPAFKLKSRLYGFEYDFLDESSARLDDLDISFNRVKGKKHHPLYSAVLSSYLEKLPVRKGFESLTEKEAIDFANTIGIEKILWFDIEPGNAASEWIVDYNSPGFDKNMAIVINRLQERGAKAYNWMEAPNRSYKNVTLDNAVLSPQGDFGLRNTEIAKYKEAYSRIGDIKTKSFPSAVFNTGYGYKEYDYNLSPTDGNNQNSGPQLTYLKALDNTELWSRIFPSKEQVYFVPVHSRKITLLRFRNTTPAPVVLTISPYILQINGRTI